MGFTYKRINTEEPFSMNTKAYIWNIYRDIKSQRAQGGQPSPNSTRWWNDSLVQCDDRLLWASCFPKDEFITWKTSSGGIIFVSKCSFKWAWKCSKFSIILFYLFILFTFLLRLYFLERLHQIYISLPTVCSYITCDCIILVLVFLL